jgi:hypothetical protein
MADPHSIALFGSNSTEPTLGVTPGRFQSTTCVSSYSPRQQLGPAVELKIVELGGQKRIWNVTEDVVDSIDAGNPHADRFGNADVWRFYAIPVAQRSTPPSS